jgi:hypothetical protein
VSLQMSPSAKKATAILCGASVGKQGVIVTQFGLLQTVYGKIRKLESK